jgi:4-amino-4-deoxy-L-arabinose transferase-like glycosyltransferase
MTHSSRRTTHAWLLLLLLCGLAFFYRLGGNGLFDLDEGLYAEAAREMNLTGDCVTPRVNGEPFFEKPPLIYWSAAAMFRLFGRSEFTARLPSALASTLLAALVFWFGMRYFGRRAGFLAAAFFILSPLVLAEARQLTTDAALDLCVTAALACFFLGYESLIASRKSQPATYDSRLTTLYALGFWASCAVGVLAKGAPGLLLPVAVAFIFLLFAERFKWRAIRRAMGRMQPAAGLLLFLLLAVPWHALAYRQSGDAFWSEYVIRQHIGRFRGGDTAHREPFWFYVPAFFLLAFPWSFLTPAALLRRNFIIEDAKVHRETPGQEEAQNSRLTTHDSRLTTHDSRLTTHDSRLFLQVWTVVVFLLFSIAGSKLVSYILPMFPAAALLTGDRCARAMERREAGRALRWGLGTAFFVALLLFGVALFHAPILRLAGSLSHRPVKMEDVPSSLISFATHLFGVTALAAGAAFVLLWERRRAAFGALLAGMTLFTGVAVFEGLSAIDAAFCRPLQSLAADAGREAAATGAPLVLSLSPPRRPSVLFYLPDALLRRPPVEGRRVFETAERAQIDAYLAQNPQAVLLTDSDNAQYLLRDPSTRAEEQRGKWLLLRRGSPGPGP